MTATSDTPPSSAHERIYLSAPDVGKAERQLLLEAFDSNWIAPLGPHVDLFETEFANVVRRKYAVALSSGTAALHLALLILGVGPDDHVILPTLTFVATANAVRYTGATPVFVDSEPTTWNIDPNLLSDELQRRARQNRLPKAIITVDLYGQCADYATLQALADLYEIPLVEDAAEALGALHRGRPAGSFGSMAAFSFNGNKIITTSGGGMLVTDREDWAEKARYLASQARLPAPHYEHSETGYNYRLSNLLAAVGRAQLASLTAKVDRRREIFRRYVTSVGCLAGITFMPEPTGWRSTRWLTVALIDPSAAACNRDSVIASLLLRRIESRPTWKPMHLQQLYSASRCLGGSLAADIFRDGICLPSGSGLTDMSIDIILNALQDILA